MKARELSGAAGFCALLAAAVGVAAFFGFGEGRIPHIGDWDQYVAFFEIQRRALIDHGELPWWNPWLLGGIPGVAHPQFTTLSPFFLPILAFGSAAGSFVFFALHVFAGCTGVYVLARRLRRDATSAAAAAAIFALAFLPIVSGGVANRMNGSLVPWLIVGLIDARRGARGVALTAIVTALLLLEGGIYALVGGGILALILALGDGGPREVARTALRFGAGLVLGFALAGVRVLPMLELYGQFPRDSGMYASVPIFDPKQLATFPGAIAALLCARHVGQRDWLFGQFLFVGTSLTTALLALLLFGLWAARRRPLLLIALFVPLLLTLGNASPLNLWVALTRLPGLSSLNLPMSLLAVPYVALSLLVADASTRLVALAGGGERLQRWGACALAATGVALLAFQSHALRSNWRSEAVPPAAPATTPFAQETGDRDAMLPSIRRNVGVIAAYEEVVRSKLKVGAKGRGERDYHGEWYLVSNGAAIAPAHWSPNRVEFDWDGRAIDRLVVNQNALPGWRATFDGRDCDVEPLTGCLSVRLPMQRGRLVLRYAPRSVEAGVFVSSAGLVLLLLLATAPVRRLLSRPADGRQVGSIEGRLSPP